jgi:hypothetical protein
MRILVDKYPKIVKIKLWEKYYYSKPL